MNWAPPAAKAGDEIIVYWSERLMKLTAIFEQLTATGLPVRVVAPGLRPEHAAKFPRLIFESKPLHFSEIARRARLVISNAPAGFVSAAMLAGLPQAVLPYDVQKELVGQAIESLGVGVSDSLARVDWKAWRQKIEMLYADVGTRGRAVTWASKLAPRMHRPPAEICAEALAQLV
jgi:UDP:flavonoid glycosyltransferase YjiC (YdhE family)